MNIRGRVDVYCTESAEAFIAVASSAELNDSGRPTVVRIVEFMATDPLYKATRIGDFGDFEFRATELHDDIMTLAQVQQLWNQVPADARWWPVDPYGVTPHLAPDLIYAVLGPWATADLLRALKKSGGHESTQIEWLIGGLDDVVGRRPNMLLALLAAIGATDRYWNQQFIDQIPERRGGGVITFGSDTLKLLGGLILESGRRFGFDEKSLGEWFDSESSHLYEKEPWPPTQVPYTLDGPEIDHSVSLPSADFSDPSEPTSLEERQKIQRWLEVNSGITTSIYGPNGPVVVPSTFSARSWARLVSATVQAMHMLLADPDVNWTVLSEQEMFIYHLSESISSLPIDSWEQLTPSRRICFVADLGELLMIVAQLVGGDVTGRIAVTLARACGNDADLISIAEQAGRNLPYADDRGDFNWGIEFVRGYQP